MLPLIVQIKLKDERGDGRAKKYTQTRVVGIIISTIQLSTAFIDIHVPIMTRTSSRNVGKFYQTVKLSAKNLRLFH